MRWRSLFLSLSTVSLLLSLPSSAVAQDGGGDGTEGEPTPEVDSSEDKAKVSLLAEAGFVWLAGNTQQITANGLLKFGLVKGKNTFGAKLGADYGRAVVETDWATTATKFSAELRYDRSFTDLVGLYVLAGFMQDRFAGYDYALNASVGPVFALVATDRHSLKGEVGATYIFEDYIDGVDPNRQQVYGGRGFLGYALKLSETASITEDLEVLLGGTDNQDAPFDGRLLSTTGLSATLAKGLSVKLGFGLIYDFVTPDPTIKQLDTKTSVTLVSTLL
jgi:putative salt-induced outer membrane protein YdiY